MMMILIMIMVVSMTLLMRRATAASRITAMHMAVRAALAAIRDHLLTLILPQLHHHHYHRHQQWGSYWRSLQRP